MANTLLTSRFRSLAVIAASVASATSLTVLSERPAAAQVEVPVFVVDETEGDTSGPTDNLDELVVQSAAKRTESIFESASIVTVITGDQIKAAGYQTLDDVLNALPGFEARRARFFWGVGSRAWGRGAGRVILFLVNGVPINLGKSDIPNGFSMPLIGVKRIEVISGPGGVVWGANAYLGVVNMIVEPELEGTTAEVQLLAGSGAGLENTVITTVAGSQSFADGKVRAALWFRYLTTEDFDTSLAYDVLDGPSSAPRTDGTFELTKWSGSIKRSRDNIAQVRAAFDIFGVRIDAMLPVYERTYYELSQIGVRADVYTNPETGVRHESGRSTRFTSRPTLISARYGMELTENASLDARLFYSGHRHLDDDFVNYPPSVDDADSGGRYPLGAFNKDYEVNGKGLFNDAEYAYGGGLDFKHDAKRNSLLVGVEAFVEGNTEMRYDLYGQVVLGPIISTKAATRNTISLYANDRLRLGKLEVEGGGRLQYNEVFGLESVLSAAGLYRLAENMFFKVNYAQGFRPPTTRTMNRNDDPVTNPVAHQYGNPDLQPERSQSLEFEASGLFLRGQGQIRYLRLALGYQWTELSNLIVDRGERFVNSSGVRVVNSVEARAELRLQNVRTSLTYYWMNAVDSAYGDVRNAANNKLVLSLDGKLSTRVRFYVGCVLYGAREDLNRTAYQLAGSNEFVASPSAAVVDRLAPVAEVDASLIFGGFWDGRLDFRLYAYNALNTLYFSPDEDFEKRSAVFSMSAPQVAVLGGLSLRL